MAETVLGKDDLVALRERSVIEDYTIGALKPGKVFEAFRSACRLAIKGMMKEAVIGEVFLWQ